MVRLGIIGYGYWGPNIVRNIHALTDATVSWVCDINPKVLTHISHQYPTIKTTSAIDDLLGDPQLDGVVIVTPISTHFHLAQQALKARKHVLVEKPLTMLPTEASRLVHLATRQHRVLMVDHTFLYTPAIEKIKEIINSGQLGDLISIECVRTNLGLFQHDSNVVYDLATHDIAILDYLIGSLPLEVSGTGFTYAKTKQECVAHVTALYPHQLFAHYHISWLSPIKIRTITIVGSKQMLYYDDIEPTEKIKIFDKGVDIVKDPKQVYQLRMGYRSGDATIPHLPLREGLAGLVTDFVSAISGQSHPRADGHSGLRVVKCLSAINRSLNKHGKLVRV